MKVIFYQKQSGRQPVVDFLNRLSVKESARIVACLSSIEQLGYDSPRVIFRQIKGHLWEIKIRVNKIGFRLFYLAIKREMIVVLHAYKKQSQKAPQSEIKVAEKRLKEVLANESAYID
ncbi:MAG: type II toxin-antitoxin system RelE/ParE family toxin [Gammaproteobacteria bacterium]